MAYSTQGNQEDDTTGHNGAQTQQRYSEERAKRLREDGNDQFIDISRSDKFHSLMEDPWIDASRVKCVTEMFPNNQCQLLILGAGLGGLLYGIRMIEAGIPASNIRIIDSDRFRWHMVLEPLSWTFL